tara:strand:- start:826 stop:1482 length:657 start_codon:yes stop_codon:yes gene_type:complete
MFKILKIIFFKDVLIELRDKGNFYYILILSAVFSLVFTSYLDYKYILFSFYITLLITNMLVNQRISRQELGKNDELIVFSLPFDLSIFCIAKIIFNFIIFIFQAILLIFLYNLFSNSYYIEFNYNFILFTIIYILGLSIFFTCFSLMLERIKGEGQFMFITILPLVVPFLFLSFNTLNQLYYYEFSEFIKLFNLQLLIAFDILLFAVCPILFSYALRR